MRSRLRMFAALVALFTFFLFQGGGVWASVCSADMGMRDASSAEQPAPADDSRESDPGSSPCPLIPAGTNSCVGTVALPPTVAAPAHAGGGDPSLLPYSDPVKHLLLAHFLLRPPQA